MLLVFLILIVVTVCVTIVGTYFLLNAENYHWQWTSFFSAFSTAVYVYLYSVYYYYVKTKMSGFFQTSFYFGYTMMFCLGLGILCGEYEYQLDHFCHIESIYCLCNFNYMSWYFVLLLVSSNQACNLNLGAVGFLGSHLFVRRIYRNIKCD